MFVGRIHFAVSALRLAVFLLLVLVPVTPAMAAVEMIYPEPSSVVTQSRHLVLKLGPADASAVVVTVNGVASDPLPIGTTEYRRAFRDFLILQPLWDKGKNEITVDLYQGEKKLEEYKAVIFYAPPDQKVDIPKEFTTAVMHRPEIEALCVPCHAMRPTAKQLAEADRDSPCYSCHKRMANMKSVHTPVAMFSCTSCHSADGEPKYAPVRRESDLCFSCHKDKQKEFKGFKLLHGPLAGDMCEICHDPHYSDTPGQLRQPVNALCLSCHEHVATGIHAISLGGGEGHPIAGKTDISERGKGRELSCISCHDPHGGKRYYFITGGDDKMALCQMCHQK